MPTKTTPARTVERRAHAGRIPPVPWLTVDDILEDLESAGHDLRKVASALELIADRGETHEDESAMLNRLSDWLFRIAENIGVDRVQLHVHLEAVTPAR